MRYCIEFENWINTFRNVYGNILSYSKQARGTVMLERKPPKIDFVGWQAIISL